MKTTLRRTTTTRKRRKRKSDQFVKISRPFLLPFDHPISMRLLTALLVLFGLAGAALTSAAAGGGVPTQTGSHAHDFLIFATVFTDRGFALPGARVRVRREDERKFRWEAMSDSRGELGIRVQQGAEYEMTIEAKGFKSQTRKIDARDGDREDVTLQMELPAGGKP